MRFFLPVNMLFLKNLRRHVLQRAGLAALACVLYVPAVILLDALAAEDLVSPKIYFASKIGFGVLLFIFVSGYFLSSAALGAYLTIRAERPVADRIFALFLWIPFFPILCYVFYAPLTDGETILLSEAALLSLLSVLTLVRGPGTRPKFCDILFTGFAVVLIPLPVIGAYFSGKMCDHAFERFENRVGGLDEKIILERMKNGIPEDSELFEHLEKFVFSGKRFFPSVSSRTAEIREEQAEAEDFFRTAEKLLSRTPRVVRFKVDADRDFTDAPDFPVFRTISRAYADRAFLAATDGKKMEYLHALDRIFDASEYVFGGFGVNSLIIGYASAEEAFSVMGIPAAFLTDADFAEMDERIRAIQEKSETRFRRALADEFFVIADFFDAMPVSYLPDPEKVLRVSECDGNSFLPGRDYWGEIFSSVDRLLALEGFLKEYDAMLFPDGFASCSAFERENALLPKIFFARRSLTFATENVLNRHAEFQEFCRATLIGVASRRFCLKYGVFPTKPDFLIPEFLPEQPKDRDGKAFQYDLKYVCFPEGGILRFSGLRVRSRKMRTSRAFRIVSEARENS